MQREHIKQGKNAIRRNPTAGVGTLWSPHRFTEEFGITEFPVGYFQVVVLRRRDNNPNRLSIEVYNCFARNDDSLGILVGEPVADIIGTKVGIQCPNVAIVCVADGVTFQAGDIQVVDLPEDT